MRTIFFTIVWFLLILPLSAQTVIGWRGINRDGVYHEKNLLKSWGAEGPECLWSVEGVGKGYSTPVVSDGMLFVTGMDEDEKYDVLTAFTLDGKMKYKVKFGEVWREAFPETKTTPAVINGKVYVISGIGEVVCIDAKSGEILWSVNGEEKFGVITSVWGVSESPLVFDNKVIFTPGGFQTTMVALDAKTGNTIWATKSLNDTCSHSSPLLINHNGKKQIIGCSREYLFGVNPETGEIIWTFNDWDFDMSDGINGIVANTPLYHNGRIFVSNAYDMRSHSLELNRDATDVKLLWRNDSLNVHTGGMVLVNGTVFASNFIKNNAGDWAAVDWETGETLYKQDWAGHSKGSIITADGMLYCYEERQGKLALVRPNKEKFDIISEFKIKQGSGGRWAHPSIKDGVLYIRHGDVLSAYKIK